MEQERDWAAVAVNQCRLDREGGTKLFTDLVMSTKNDKIFLESIQLAICLLEGGNTEIQVTKRVTFDLFYLLFFSLLFKPMVKLFCYRIPSIS